MRSTQNIIEEYGKADVEKRLDLFLECPSLRTRFAEIDQSETAGESLGDEFNWEFNWGHFPIFPKRENNR